MQSLCRAAKTLRRCKNSCRWFARSSFRTSMYGRACNRSSSMTLDFATIPYRTIRDRLLAEDPRIDEQTLADTVEGLTNLPEVLMAIIRAALTDQALATGLESRIAEMQARRGRFPARGTKQRQIAQQVTSQPHLK